MTSSFHDTNRNGSGSQLSRVKYMDVQQPVRGVGKVVAGWLQLQMQLGLSCGGWSGGFAQSDTDEPGLHDRICTEDRRHSQMRMLRYGVFVWEA